MVANNGNINAWPNTDIVLYTKLFIWHSTVSWFRIQAVCFDTILIFPFSQVSEEKAIQRQENYQKQIRELRDRLKDTEARDDNATMNIARLNVKIDQTEEALLSEKLKIKKISDDLNQTFDDMLTFW